MTWISNPSVRFKCCHCGKLVERQILASRAEQEINDLRDGPPLRCAQCEQHHEFMGGDATCEDDVA